MQDSYRLTKLLQCDSASSLQVPALTATRILLLETMHDASLRPGEGLDTATQARGRACVFDHTGYGTILRSCSRSPIFEHHVKVVQRSERLTYNTMALPRKASMSLTRALPVSVSQTADVTSPPCTPPNSTQPCWHSLPCFVLSPHRTRPRSLPF